jgi:hypothetical protein
MPKAGFYLGLDGRVTCSASQASTASGAVSARSTRGPRSVARKPAARAAASSSAVRPPSGPAEGEQRCARGLPGSPAAGQAAARRAQAQQQARPGRARRQRLQGPARRQLCRRHLRHHGAAALLAGRLGDGLPVFALAFGAFALQAQHRAFAVQRLDHGRAQLGGLFNQRVHALVGRHGQRQGHGQGSSRRTGSGAPMRTRTSVLPMASTVAGQSGPGRRTAAACRRVARAAPGRGAPGRAAGCNRCLRPRAGRRTGAAAGG